MVLSMILYTDTRSDNRENSNRRLLYYETANSNGVVRSFLDLFLLLLM